MASENLWSRLVGRVRRAIVPCVLWFGRHFLKWNRLEAIDLIDLGATLDEVVSLYGDPIESEPVEDFPEASSYTFSASPFHDAVVIEWNGAVALVTYWSVHADPNRDLRCMLVHYGKGVGWDILEEGYLCVRRDGKVRLWCSAAPAIGVAMDEYLTVKNKKESPGTPPTAVARPDGGPQSSSSTDPPD